MSEEEIVAKCLNIDPYEVTKEQNIFMTSKGFYYLYTNNTSKYELLKHLQLNYIAEKRKNLEAADIFVPSEILKYVDWDSYFKEEQFTTLNDFDCVKYVIDEKTYYLQEIILLND